MPKFFTQYSEDLPSWALETTEPTCTIPDQSMTIQEIIAKFTRTGLVPQSYLRQDEGGNVASEPGSDPLDDMQAVLAAAREEAAAAHGSAEPDQPGSGEPAHGSAGEGAGNGGE